MIKSNISLHSDLQNENKAQDKPFLNQDCSIILRFLQLDWWLQEVILQQGISNPNFRQQERSNRYHHLHELDRFGSNINWQKKTQSRNLGNISQHGTQKFWKKLSTMPIQRKKQKENTLLSRRKNLKSKFMNILRNLETKFVLMSIRFKLQWTFLKKLKDFDNKELFQVQIYQKNTKDSALKSETLLKSTLKNWNLITIQLLGERTSSSRMRRMIGIPHQRKNIIRTSLIRQS